MSLRLKYFIVSILLSGLILAAGILFIYHDARSYLISGLGREAVTLGKTVASSVSLEHTGIFSLQGDKDKHSELKIYLTHIHESNSTIRHINLILMDNQIPVPLLKTGDSESDELQSNSKIKTAIATGETVYDREIRVVNNSRVMGAVVPIIKNGVLEGLVCVDLVADNLAAALARLNQYTLMVSMVLLVLVTVTCFKTSEALADRQELYSGSVNSVDNIVLHPQKS